jgi:hypothetical protein
MTVTRLSSLLLASLGSGARRCLQHKTTMAPLSLRPAERCRGRPPGRADADDLRTDPFEGARHHLPAKGAKRRRTIGRSVGGMVLDVIFGPCLSSSTPPLVLVWVQLKICNGSVAA